jgi:hypothetical protein
MGYHCTEEMPVSQNGIYPLGNIQKAMENGPFTVDLPIQSGDFQ